MNSKCNKRLEGLVSGRGMVEGASDSGLVINHLWPSSSA